MEEQALENSIDRLKPWVHNLHLPNGIQTAPNHPLGDFRSNKWQQISPFIPTDLTDWSIIDIGCNAGFYSLELARRGASVTAIDIDNHYLQQARWAARLCSLESRILFRQMQVYELARRPENYDLVWFMGVFYHLRYPFLALNIVRQKVKRLMVFQTLTMPGGKGTVPEWDPERDQRDVLLAPEWPKMAFIEGRFAHDPTNWLIRNQPCIEALLRSSGLKIGNRPGDEIFLCEPGAKDASDLSRLAEAELKAAVGVESST